MDPRGELRQNVLTGHWVAIAPRRADRPVRPGDGREDSGSDPGGRGDECPFCPGHEDQLPEILHQRDGGDGGWEVRVVPNRYPAFTNDPGRGEFVEAGLAGSGSGLGRTLALGSDVPVVLAEPLPAVGYQEVIIESPAHSTDLPFLERDHLRAVVETYHERYRAVSASVPNCRVFLFRNRGRAAGNSLSHPHAQLIATTVVPPEVRVREIRMLGYHGDHGRCLVCSLPDLEPGWDERLVARNEHFTAIVPWAAETGKEVWIIPRKHQADFGDALPDARAGLADLLGVVLRAYRDRGGDPPYNLMLHSPRMSRSGSRAFHWFLQLRPREAQMAGFEMASGITVNASSPEGDARALRGEDDDSTEDARGSGPDDPTAWEKRGDPA